MNNNHLSIDDSEEETMEDDMASFMKRNRVTERFSHVNHVDINIENDHIILEEYDNLDVPEEEFNVPINEIAENQMIKMFANVQEKMARENKCHIVGFFCLFVFRLSRGCPRL